MKKYILKISLFVFILLVILVILSAILVPKNNSEEAGMHNMPAMGILGEKENTVDIIMYGDSESIASTMPKRLWDEYGYTAYICGTSGQSMPDTCRIMYETLKKQKPKIVILEANNTYNPVGIFVPVARIINVMLPVTEYHNRWKSLRKEDFSGKKEYTYRDESKGYHYIDKNIPADDSHYMEYSEEVEQIPAINKFYIKILKKYAESKGAKFVIVSVPSCKNWNYRKHNGTKEFAEKEDIEFLDLNELKDEVKIDWERETGDGGDHVNYKGATKVTDYLGKWLNKKNILENHKNDENYKKWEEDLEKSII